MKTITIPATSANMGPGFDCMGLALRIYNTISFEFMEKGLKIDLPEQDRRVIPTDARNLIYRVFCNTLHEHGVTPPGLHFAQTNEIPSVRGLGSSAACVVGGVIMADIYMGEKMSVMDKLELCAAEDGHPDNVLPALIGGIAVGCIEGRKVYYERFDAPENLRIAAFVPPFPLATKKARQALPAMVPYQDAVFNLSRAALLASALAKGNLSLLKPAMQDRLHQPYREPLIPGYQDILRIAEENGALSVCLSGAGPTVTAFLEGDGKAFEKRAAAALEALSTGWRLHLLEVDREGCVITG